MALNDAALVVAATAVKNAVTHLQLHTANAGPAWTTNLTTAARAAVANGVVDADGDITWTSSGFAGGAASGPATHVSYWSAVTAGTNYGGAALTGDLAFNAVGEYTSATVIENSAAT